MLYKFVFVPIGILINIKSFNRWGGYKVLPDTIKTIDEPLHLEAKGRFSTGRVPSHEATDPTRSTSSFGSLQCTCCVFEKQPLLDAKQRGTNHIQNFAPLSLTAGGKYKKHYQFIWLANIIIKNEFILICVYLLF